MKTKTIFLLSAAAAFLPLTILSQPAAPPSPSVSPSAPNPPSPPVPPLPPRAHDREPKVPVTFLGVETSEVPSVLCDQLGLAKGFGLVVDYVVPDGPAAAAGVQQNDVIKMLNDQILTDPNQLAKLVRSYSQGTMVTLTLMRKGQEQKVSVKLAKKEVPRRHADMEHMPGMDWNFDFGNIDEAKQQMKEQMAQFKEQLGQLGDENKGIIHDAVLRARDEARRAVEQARRAAGQIRTVTRNNGALQQTTIDLNKAQIVLSDDKGELRIENRDGKKMLTAKDAEGKLLFSGPVETKEELDKVPADVRQRYEKLQQHDLPAMAPDDLRAEPDMDMDDNDNDDEEDEDTSRSSGAASEQVSNNYSPFWMWPLRAAVI